jgi:thymidylate kinase
MARPLIIELAGLPAAGKTSAAEILRGRLRSHSIACMVVNEAAQRNPLQRSKCEWPFNVWSSSQTLTNILEARERGDVAVVVVDRGLIDAQCWMLWLRNQRKIDERSYIAIRDFLRGPLWASSTALVVELKVEFQTALRRRGGDTGRIFNAENFKALAQAYRRALLDPRARHKDTRLARIDTTELTLSEVVGRIEAMLPPALRGGEVTPLADYKGGLELIEAKETDWDQIKPHNVRATALRHAREFTRQPPGAGLQARRLLVYPTRPHSNGRAEAVADALAEHEIAVNWRTRN